MKHIFIGADHGGFELKSQIISTLSGNFSFTDCGTNSELSCDYPDISQKTIQAFIGSPEQEKYGILICKTGIGMSISANRNSQIRAAICHDEISAQLAKQHNNANFLCLGSLFTDCEKAVRIVKIFLNTQFSDEIRHAIRVGKL